MSQSKNLHDTLAVLEVDETASPAELHSAYEAKKGLLETALDTRKQLLREERRQTMSGTEAILLPTEHGTGLYQDPELNSLQNQLVDLETAYSMSMDYRDKYGADPTGIIPEDFKPVSLDRALDASYEPQITNEAHEALAARKKEADERWSAQVAEWRAEQEKSEQSEAQGSVGARR